MSYTLSEDDITFTPKMTPVELGTLIMSSANITVHYSGKIVVNDVLTIDTPWGDDTDYVLINADSPLNGDQEYPLDALKTIIKVLAENKKRTFSGYIEVWDDDKPGTNFPDRIGVHDGIAVVDTGKAVITYEVFK